MKVGHGVPISKLRTGRRRERVLRACTLRIGDASHSQVT